MHGADGPGPVHLNLAFREPLTGTAAPLPARHGSEGGRPGRGEPGPATDVELEPLRGRG